MLNKIRPIGSGISVRAIALGLFAVTAVSTGCPSLIHVNHPVAPPQAIGGDPHAGFYSHYFQLNWNGGDLGELASLAVSHAQGIEVMTDPHVDQLSLVLQLDIQQDQHLDLASAYENEVRSGSSLRGNNPKVVLPARTCTEVRSAEGLVTSVTHGVCVRNLAIVIPARKVLALELAWKGDSRIDGVTLSKLTLDLPAAGSANVHALNGALLLQGGGVSASILADSIKGDLTSHVTTVSRMELKSINGKVLLFVDQPEHANVTLDGARIQTFPFLRP